METIFLVWLPGFAALCAGLAVLIGILLFMAPRAYAIIQRTNAQKLNEAERLELRTARALLAKIASDAEDDAILEIQLGNDFIKQIRAVVPAELTKER